MSKSQSNLVLFSELQPCKVFNTPCTLTEPLSAPKNHRSHILLSYAWIHPSYLGQSFAKVTAPNSKYSQSYNHAKFLILHVHWQSRCQHPKIIDHISCRYWLLPLSFPSAACCTYRLILFLLAAANCILHCMFT